MRCPVCKADNLQGPQCRRCKADLSLLFALEDQRWRTLAEAQRCLLRGEVGEAIQRIEAAGWLRDDEKSRRLAALAHLLAGDFALAWRGYLDWRTARRSDWNGPW